jgi:hypothetical protein
MREGLVERLEERECDIGPVDLHDVAVADGDVTP